MLRQQVKKKQESFFKNKNIKMFLFFLLLSSLFWLLINLSKEYIDAATFNVTYYNLPKSKVIQNVPVSKIDVGLKTHGFRFLTYRFKKKNIQINLSYLQHLRQNTYFYLPNNQIRDFQNQFPQDVEVLNVVADTLFFELTTNAVKKVKITPSLDINFKTGYNLSESIKIEPDSVLLQGPKTWLDSVEEVVTETLLLENLSENISQPLDLKIIDDIKINYSISQVNLKIKVDKFTETNMVLGFEIINLPKDFVITTIPKEVTVKYQVSLSNFNKVNASMFIVECDYAVSTRDSLNYLIPKIVKKPHFVNSVTIYPNRIEYLIKK